MSAIEPAHQCEHPDVRASAAIVRAARLARHWSQTDLGRRCGYSASTISRLESGRKPLRDVVLLRSLAEALELPPHVFGLTRADRDRPGAAAPLPRRGPPRVVGIAVEQEDDVLRRRDVLSGLAGLLGMTVVPRTPATSQSIDVSTLRQRLVSARADFDACRYSAVATAVPAVVLAAHQMVDVSAPGRLRDQYSAVLADSYSLGAFVGDKLGNYGVSAVLADRARTHATISGNSTSLATATREAAVALRRARCHDDAVTLLTNTANTLPTNGPDGLAARGALLLTASYTNARNGRGDHALDLASEASNVARHLPDRWPADALFTRTQVAVYLVGIHTALGNSGRALDVARAIRLDALPSVERRVKVCLDVARAFLTHGDTGRSFAALRTAERMAPQDVRRPSVQQLTRELLDHPGAEPEGLAAFARRIGATSSI